MFTKVMELVKECMSYSGAVSLRHNGALSANGSQSFAVHLSEFIPPLKSSVENRVTVAPPLSTLSPSFSECLTQHCDLTPKSMTLLLQLDRRWSLRDGCVLRHDGSHGDGSDGDDDSDGAGWYPNLRPSLRGPEIIIKNLRTLSSSLLFLNWRIKHWSSRGLS